MQKTYLAICSGIFAEKNGTLNGAIAPLPGSLMKMCVSKDGKTAVTHYQVQKQYMEAALVQLTLETGRTHQIRVHMADAGHPLIGDRLYFADTDQKQMWMQRIALPASNRQHFMHPGSVLSAI